MPREDPNCDTGRFQLSDAVYDKVEQCQRAGSAQQDLRQVGHSVCYAKQARRDEYIVALQTVQSRNEVKRTSNRRNVMNSSTTNSPVVWSKTCEQ